MAKALPPRPLELTRFIDSKEAVELIKKETKKKWLRILQMKATNPAELSPSVPKTKPR